MPSKGDVFVQEFVLGFGFIGGLFTRFNVDPELEVIKALLIVLTSLYPSVEPYIPLILLLISILLTAVSILFTHELGGKLGLLAVALAFIAGFFIIDPLVQLLCILLIFVAMFLGSYAVSQKR